MSQVSLFPRTEERSHRAGNVPQRADEGANRAAARFRPAHAATKRRALSASSYTLAIAKRRTLRRRSVERSPHTDNSDAAGRSPGTMRLPRAGTRDALRRMRSRPRRDPGRGAAARSAAASDAEGHPTHDRALSNNCCHGEHSPHSAGCHDSCAVRNTRSGCGIMIVTRPSALQRPAIPCGEPFGFAG
jgi:hypothetical protein